MDEKNLIRINKFLSESGFCSRREADRFIQEGMVKVNGRLAVLGDRVSSTDKVYVKNKLILRRKKKIYLAFYKPRGIVCTSDAKREKNNIIDYIDYPERIFPIGRLDKLSEGLIFLTNDGDIVNKILRSVNGHEKEYEVTVNKKITKHFVSSMENGVPILNTITKKCVIKKISSKKFNIILTQGLNRQIRRMCEHFGYKVLTLKRIRIMNINLDLSVGNHRFFTNKELFEIRKLTHNSTKSLD